MIQPNINVLFFLGGGQGSVYYTHQAKKKKVIYSQDIFSLHYAVPCEVSTYTESSDILISGAGGGSDKREKLLQFI